MGTTVVEQLALHRSYVPLCAFWAYSHWYQNRDIPFEIILRAYERRASSQSNEKTLIALEKDVPVGMVTLKRFDIWNRRDLSPWLASLYVADGFRRRGTGKLLVDALVSAAREAGYRQLFLFLDRRDAGHLFDFYSRLGWSFHEEAVDNDGFPTRILTYRF